MHLMRIDKTCVHEAECGCTAFEPVDDTDNADTETSDVWTRPGTNAYRYEATQAAEGILL